MEELGKVITELIRTGRDVGQIVAIGYFTFRILEVMAWPAMWFGLGFSVVRVVGLKLVEGWKLRQRVLWERARTEHLQQLITAELLVERRQKEKETYIPPAWYQDAVSDAAYWDPGMTS